MKLSVEELTKETVPFVYEVYEQNREVLHGNHISLDDWYEFLIGRYADPFEKHFIIMFDKTPVAWLKLNGLNDMTICISMLVVAKSYQHKGIGKYALKYAESFAKSENKSAILIQTTKDNIIAAECYENCGYKKIREMIYKVGDGVDREGYEFKKEF